MQLICNKFSWLINILISDNKKYLKKAQNFLVSMGYKIE